MFVLKASVWLAALEAFRPDILECVRQAWDKRAADRNFLRPGLEEFHAISAESIDYAEMERCPDSVFPIAMVPLDAGWNDLGAWDSVWKLLPKDTGVNAHFGDVLTSDSRSPRSCEQPPCRADWRGKPHRRRNPRSCAGYR